MSNQELVSYIKKGLTDGHSRAEIETALKQSGWQAADIQQAFAAAPANGAANVGEKLPGIFALIGIAWHTYANRFGTLFGLIALPFTTLIGLLLLFSYVVGLSIGFDTLVGLNNPVRVGEQLGSHNLFNVGVIVFFVIFLLVQLLIQSWAQVALVFGVRGSSFGEALRQGLKNITGYYWVMLLAAVFEIGAFGLFVIPAAVVGVWFTFAGFAYVIEGKRGIQALWASKALVKDRWWEIFGMTFMYAVLVGLPIFILLALINFTVGNGLITAGIIQQIVVGLIVPPFTIAFFSALYDAARQRPAVVQPSKKLVVFVIVGYILLALATFGIIQAAQSGINYASTHPLTDQQKQELQKLLQKGLPSGINQLNPDPLQPPNSDPEPGQIIQ